MTTNTTQEIQGFASRRNNSCLADEVSCVHTWGTWYACCPSGSSCPGAKVSVPNNVCCASWTDCTAQIENPPYFCCEGDAQGFGFRKETWVGCAPAGFQGDASYSALTTIATITSFGTNTVTTTAAATTTANASGTTIFPKATANTGAVAGGVVGGVVGVSALAAVVWWMLRRRKKALPPQPVVSLQPQ
ncbi:uncharacterized protein BP01DRAFT_370709 [Aspergillus saccharolyticus JOP 1030-1]|uniref:Uncharacterized protein n=1 Tax=Aspergillus saccharolyticus JOP 1030-1 TaxID=1450539 RepID=A0A318ZQ64_9EURO|nr:hypothetical protein BP01DRAFT_370709 [Aspergillus saccharolyticus JOP 1030-1]PYH49177.1 hypothetical protein BP01DRAFT_370709 [Aspergillus saccharolyticus JOP 1030-1]